uniref:DUF4781 domain-containing protein n=1 Tax=Stomoxys calcitrans TaxID=35570 RepID=A0A1I8NXR2_STOCA
MATRKQLEKEMRDVLGGNKYSVAKKLKIASLSTKKLIAFLKARSVPIEYPTERAYLVDLLKAVMDGSDEILDIQEVDIENMTDVELQMGVLQVCKPKKSVREIQQELAENCGFQQAVIWDLTKGNSSDFMQEKIKQLIPDQEKGQNSVEKMRASIFNSVWAQRKYTNGNSLTSIFYVMVTPEENLVPARESTTFSCHPVFRCRKCIVDNNDSSNCCMIYVDETGRVYQNWNSFIEDNVLPAGILVTPRRGVYNFDERNNVILEIYRTPNGKPGTKLMNAAQTGSAVLGMGAAVVPLAALALPIAAPVVAGAALVGLGVGAFTSITSALNLRDRAKHEQTLSVMDSQARSNYLGVAGGILGMAAAGATRAMTSMAAAGKATKGLEVLVNGINVSSIVLSGSGVANGALDLIFKFRDNDEISSIDILQLSASLVLFTHSLYNFQLASRIANDARTNSIKSYREALSGRQRRMFDKMSKETIRTSGEKQGKIDIVRNINKIPDRQYLNDMFKVNKQMNKANVKPSFGPNGLVLNNEVPIDAAALRQNVNILKQVTNPIPSTHQAASGSDTALTAGRLYYTTNEATSRRECNNLCDVLNDSRNFGISKEILGSLYLTLSNGIGICLKDYGNKFLQNIIDSEKFQDVISTMAKNFPDNICKHILGLAQRFIDDMLDEIMRQVRSSISTESIIYRILELFVKKYKDVPYAYIAAESDKILMTIKIYFLSLNTSGYGGTTKCTHCVGRYSVCSL